MNWQWKERAKTFFWVSLLAGGILASYTEDKFNLGIEDWMIGIFGDKLGFLVWLIFWIFVTASILGSLSSIYRYIRLRK